MNGSNTTAKIGNKINDKSEQRLKQACLPFKTKTIKKSVTETGKKRKHDDDTDTAASKVSQPVYIDLTDQRDAESTPQVTLNDDIDVKSTKVCILQGEPKDKVSIPTVNAAESVHNNKTDSTAKSIEKPNPLQKWLKSKKSEVTSASKKATGDTDHQNENNAPNKFENETSPPQGEVVFVEKTEPMEVDSENSTPSNSQPSAIQESENSNGNDRNLNSSSLNETNNEKFDVSTDVDVSESEKSFNAGESSVPTTPTTGLILKRKLTPKQLQKRDEIEFKKQEKERLKQEKEKKRLEEKEERKRLKEEKEKKRLAEIEAKNEEKRQKEEEKKRLKEEERKQKEEEKRQKEEERKQKDEERKQKDEEKRQKEEQKRQKEEQERRLKEKSAAVFTNFFVAKSKEQLKDNSDNADKKSHSTFMPFEVKADMRLASIVRATLDQERLHSLDEILQSDRHLDKDHLYLVQLKSKSYQPGHSENTWPLSVNEDEDDVVIVEEPSSSASNLPSNEKPMKYRCKLLQFHDNKRPAYWGTWRKKSGNVSGRTPFKQDKIFDYEVDSDEEWDDEPGESVDGSDDEKESEDEYEVDNEVFVPHGYLSDEEAQNDDPLDSSPKSNKLKLNVLGQQFEEEMKEKTHKLKPRIFGCLWIDNAVKKDEGANNVENLLLSFRAVYNEKRAPFAVVFKSNEITPQSTPSMKIRLKNEFPDSLLPQLIKLAHGSKRNTKVLAKEFNAFVLGEDSTLNLTLSCITKKLKEISVWDSKLGCRLVNDEIKNQSGLVDLSHTENNWKYVTMCEEPASEKSQKIDTEKQPAANPVSASSALSTSTQNQKVKPNVPSITKFVKKLTPEEKQMAIEKNLEKPISIASASPQSKPKPKTSITKFVKILSNEKTNHKEEKTPNQTSSQNVVDLTDDEPDVIVNTSTSPSTRKENDGKNERTDFTDLASALSPSSGRTAKNHLECKSSAAVDNQEKTANTLFPKKVKSPSVNILIPRKTPSRPIPSPNEFIKPVNILVPRRVIHADKNITETKPVNQLDPEQSENKQNHVNSEIQPVNILTPKKTKEQSIPTDFSNIFNSKPVNVLIPRRACDVKKSNEKPEKTVPSKPVNILIPRRAKDIQKKETNKNQSSVAKNNEIEEPDDSKNKEKEKTKDIIEDNASTDFSLCVEISDKSEDVEMK